MNHEFPDEMTYYPPPDDEDRRRLKSIQDRCMSMLWELDPAKTNQIEDFYTDLPKPSGESVWTIYAPTNVRAFTYSGSKVLMSRQRGVRTQNRIHTVVSYYSSGNEKKLTAKYTVKGVSWRKAKRLLRKNVGLHRGTGRVSSTEPDFAVAEPKINNTKDHDCPICEWEKSK